MQLVDDPYHTEVKRRVAEVNWWQRLGQIKCSKFRYEGLELRSCGRKASLRGPGRELVWWE